MIIEGQTSPYRNIQRSYQITAFIKFTDLDLFIVTIYKPFHLILVGLLNLFKYICSKIRIEVIRVGVIPIES